MNARHKSLVGLSLILVILTSVCYWPAGQAEFVDFDDFDYVTGNPRVSSGLSAENVAWAWRQSHAANWHPLTWISHMLDVQWFGLDAPAHHRVNIAWHAVNVVLLFLLLAWLTGEPIPSFVVAALFALHPLNVESVAWVAQRKTTLSTFFGILAIGGYVGYARGLGRWYYAASLACFAMSLLAKQMLVTLPFALLLLDYWPLERPELSPPKGKLPSVGSLARGWWRLLPNKIPYLVLALGASAAASIAQRGVMSSFEGYPLQLRLANVAISYATYLVSCVWPWHLAVYYPLNREDVTAARALMSVCLLIAVSLACYRWGRTYRYLLVGWLWFLGTLVPVIGLVQIGGQAFADRYVYVPFWGLFIALVWSARDLIVRWGKLRNTRLAVAVACGIILTALGWLTFQQARKWHDTIALFEDAAAHTRHNWPAHAALAAAHLHAKDYPRALAHIPAALDRNPQPARALNTQGMALQATGAMEKAAQSFRAAQRAAPDGVESYLNLGWLYAANGQYEQAVQQLEQAEKRLTPADTAYTRRMVYANWGSALAQLNRLSDAVTKFDRALEVSPELAWLWCDAAEAEIKLGRTPQAIARLRTAVKLDPRDPRSTCLLARGYVAQQDFARALATCREALAANPLNFDASIQWGTVLYQMGRPAEAKAQLEKTLTAIASARPANATMLESSVHAQIATIALAGKDSVTAVDHYEQALAKWPDNYLANHNLAWLLATSDTSRRDPRRALQLARRASELRQPPSCDTLSTLAVCYSLNDKLPQALNTARSALALARQTKDAKNIAEIERQIRLYEQGRPYAEP